MESGSVKKVEQYNIYLDKSLGTGAFGAVYMARDTKKDIDVAVKVIDMNQVQLDEMSIKLMKQETQSLFTIRDSPNENLVKTYEILRSPSKLYIVMEICEGGDLETYIKKNYGKIPGKPARVPESEARAIFNDILTGYKELWTKRLVHRDIKPKNILCSKGKWKIADFGFAKKIEKATGILSTAVGTPLYAAPQILNELDSYTDKCDIWSLGVMLYETLYGVGNYPWNAKSPKLLAQNIRTQKLKFPEEVPVSEDMKSLLASMLVEDETARLSWESLFKFQWVAQEIDVDDFEEGDTKTHKTTINAGKAGFAPHMKN